MFTVSKHLVQLWLDPLWNFLYLLNESVSDSEHGKERANKHLWGGSICLEKAHNAKVSPGGQCSQSIHQLGKPTRVTYGGRNENVPSTHTRNSENVPHGLRCEHLVPHWWCCLGKFRRYRFAGRSVLLGMALRCFCFLLALFLLPCLPPAATISYHDGLPPSGTLSFYLLPWSWGFTTATESN